MSELGADVERLEALADRLAQLMQRQSVGTATITIHAGGLGIWICASCALAMMVAVVMGSIFVARGFAATDAELARAAAENQARKDENSKMLTYLSAIYSMAPQLKPKDTARAK